MGNRLIFHDHRSLTRAQLAAELRRIADHLDARHDLGYGRLGTPGHLTVPEHVERELDISYSTHDGGFTVDLEFKWTTDTFADQGHGHRVGLAS
ncbi:amphi-Trp domain-containing protein [Nocardia pseudobrasiliensis]|uniref:Amphi-Trp domain-containing protein n=1 Tax=Nocardia pseudobrasiliensis TaxID=45979 RepID=A0A370IFS7_9NOCA|nr:amphi-Trp domain-containing protein [Nocardia pseudobrasiliensis]RDI68304.1 hypothetical protein DFR76_102705 [Nocardia pseudobrasiliensis]